MNDLKEEAYVGPTWVSRELGVARNTARKLMVESGKVQLVRGRHRLRRVEAESLVALVRDSKPKAD